jgi:uncharacterized protein (DUF2235 family)
VCCDGTWNVPDEARDGQPAPTNVARLADGVVCEDRDAQRMFYEPGVGTRPDERFIGGAFGVGLSRNIRNAYTFLAQNYDDGDQVFLFGFSRGAYTARSLAGLIRNCGILRAEHADRVDDAFAFYRDRTSTTHPSELASEIFRATYSHPSDRIHFIGVWDTVGALGIPDYLPGWGTLSRLISRWQELWGFHDTRLSSHVDYAYHALSIDEQRRPFKPTLWTGAAAPGQTVQQVWFAGVHSEIGGGSADHALSDIALLWIADRAREQGVQFKPGRLTAGDLDAVDTRITPNYNGPIVDSRRGFYKLLPAYHRLKNTKISDGPGQSLASSVIARRHDPNLRYAPSGIGPYESLPPTQVDDGTPPR